MDTKPKQVSTLARLLKFLKSTDISWAFGLGYNATPNVGINARYNLGLTEYYEGEKNSVIQIGVFYLLGQSKK